MLHTNNATMWSVQTCFFLVAGSAGIRLKLDYFLHNCSLELSSLAGTSIAVWFTFQWNEIQKMKMHIALSHTHSAISFSWCFDPVFVLLLSFRSFNRAHTYVHYKFFGRRKNKVWIAWVKVHMIEHSLSSLTNFINGLFFMSWCLSFYKWIASENNLPFGKSFKQMCSFIFYLLVLHHSPFVLFTLL